MGTAQVGIFAVGTSTHGYLEMNRRPGADPRAFVQALAGLEPVTTVAGVNVVVGVRPELWAAVAAPADRPADAAGFTEPLVGVDGFTMPATQHDGWLWVAGAGPDSVFDVSTTLIEALAPVAEVATEVAGWSYRHSRDLTGFEDGTENPPPIAAPAAAVVPAGQPGAGASVLLYQQWVHRAQEWGALGVAEQEGVIGRTKADSVELPDDVKPATSHVARTVIEEGGQELKIFRRNTAYGTSTEHGTMFVGFSAEQARLDRMLRRMAGAEDGIRDALTLYTTPLTGAYYVIPAVEALRAHAD